MLASQVKEPVGLEGRKDEVGLLKIEGLIFFSIQLPWKLTWEVNAYMCL